MTGVAFAAIACAAQQRVSAFGADHIAGEGGELVTGRIQGRTGDADVTIFKSLGLAIKDVAAARLASGRALERGIGTTLPG